MNSLTKASRIPEAAAELLQAVVHRRYKLRRSIAITSNRVVTDWASTSRPLPWPPPSSTGSCTACSMLEFEGKSYRLKETASRLTINLESA